MRPFAAPAASATASGATGLAFAAIPLVVLLWHFAGIGGGFLSDDYSHLHVIAQNAERGTLLQWTLARFHQGLDNGNFAYRPLAFASYVLDWLVYRTTAAGWHATNLALYFVNALLAAALARRWLRADGGAARQAAFVAAAAMVAFPFAGEISFWPVGRFDLLAGLFSLLYLHALPPAGRGSLVDHGLRVLFLLCALLSKESAMPLPLVASLVSMAEVPGGTGRLAIAARLRAAVRETAPTWLAFALYLLWRHHLFGSYWKVYPDSSAPRSIAEFAERVAMLRHVVAANVGDARIAWVLAVLLFLGVIASLALHRRDALAGRVRILACAVIGCAALYALAPAFGFPLSTATGEGSRLLYLPWVYAALGLALVTAGSRSAGWAAFGLLVVMLYAQMRSVSQWQSAAREMQRIVAHVAPFAARIAPERYALLLLPDHIGPVPFARNGQGGIVLRPIQPEDYLDRMAVTTDPDLTGWSDHLQRGTIAGLKGLARFDPANLDGLFCWNPRLSAIVPLTGGDVARDPVRWRREVEARLPATGCLAPQ
ncbi:MAG TPA: hypothetical protein VFZ14_12245 [Burkholderiales bacterium]|nr:hypothetical protein [Burkholderiales bacterium]